MLPYPGFFVTQPVQGYYLFEVVVESLSYVRAGRVQGHGKVAEFHFIKEQGGNTSVGVVRRMIRQLPGQFKKGCDCSKTSVSLTVRFNLTLGSSDRSRVSMSKASSDLSELGYGRLQTGLRTSMA